MGRLAAESEKIDPAPAGNPEAGAELAALRILVVEDNFLIAELICEMLSACGCCAIGPAPSVAAAWPLLEVGPLDGALLDVNLSGSTSFEIALALRARAIPFVFVTGYDEGTVFPDELSATERVSKPFDGDALRAVVDRHFRPSTLSPDRV